MEWSLTNSLDTRNHLKIRTTFSSGQPVRPHLCINRNQVEKVVRDLMDGKCIDLTTKATVWKKKAASGESSRQNIDNLINQVLNPAVLGSNNRLCIRTKINMAIVESFKMVYRGPGENVGKCSDLEGESDSELEDPFGVYELLNKKKKVTNNEGESQNSPTYPPGFTPNDNAEDNINTSNVEPVERGHNGDKEEGEFIVSQNQDRNDTDVDANESTCSGHFKKSIGHRTGGSIIQLIEDLVNVGQTMGLPQYTRPSPKGQTSLGKEVVYFE
nr:nucleotide-binding alpha-beta plait domain-containing protein [Tanacetum cinerariifolium]